MLLFTSWLSCKLVPFDSFYLLVSHLLGNNSSNCFSKHNHPIQSKLVFFSSLQLPFLLKTEVSGYYCPFSQTPYIHVHQSSSHYLEDIFVERVDLCQSFLFVN